METSYTNLRQQLATVLNHVADNQEVVIVRRGRARDVAFAQERSAPSHRARSRLATPRQARNRRQAAQGDGTWFIRVNSRLRADQAANQHVPLYSSRNF